MPRTHVFISICTLVLLGLWDPELSLGVEGARILGVFHVPLSSHFQCGSRLLKELSRKGHNVTMISPFEIEEKIENFKSIRLAELEENFNKIHQNSITLNNGLSCSCSFEPYKIGSSLAESVLNHSKIQDLLKDTEKFDLIIMDAFSNEAHLGFSLRYDAPVILLSSTGSNHWTNQYTRVPAPTSYVSEFDLQQSTKMTYIERMKNFINSNVMNFYFEFVHLPRQNSMLHTYFPEAPDVRELFENVAMVLLNSHVSINSPKPSVPNMVEVGGFHVDEVNELPKDLKLYLDSAPGGFVIVSLDSDLLSSNKSRIETLLKALSKLPCKVLWKYDNINMPEIPQNVRVDKSVPLNDILAHRGARLLITHRGVLNTIQAVYHGVPILEFPAIGDHTTTTADDLKIGTQINYKDFDENMFYANILHITNSKHYYENVRKRSHLMRDQPLKPIDNAIFWVEHVLRHDGAWHLQTGASKLTWYELYNLDVIALLIVVWHLILFIMFKVIKRIISKSLKKDYKVEKKKKH